MIRNLKTLGLALAAVFALGAALASVSSASVLTSDGPFTLTASETGSETNYFEAFGLKTKCPGSTFKGEAVGGGDLASGATTFTLKPTWVNCTIAGLPSTFDMNSCHFVLHVGAAGAVTLDEVCPEGKDITETIFVNATDHANNVPFCIFHIDPTKNQGLGGATLSNHAGSSPKDLDLTGAFNNVHVVVTDLGTHPLICPGPSGGSETKTNGKLAVDLTITGDNESGTSTEVSIS